MIGLKGKICLVVAFAFLPLSRAQNSNNTPQFTRSSDTHHLTVTTTNCESARKIAIALTNWKSNLGEVIPTVPAAEMKGPSSCSIDIEDRVPNFVKEYQGLHPEVDWGNCWGVALAASGMIPYFTQTIGTADDIPSWMDPDRCKPVSYENVSAGDIGRISSSAGSQPEIHGFVYVSPGVVFSKNGFMARNEFKLQSFSEMYKAAISIKNPACLALENKEKISGCTEKIQYYHCISYADLKKKVKSISEEYSSSDKKLQVAEKLMVKKAMSCKEPIENTRGSLKSVADAVYNMASEKMEDKSIDPNERLMWKALYLRAQSLMGYL